MANMLIGIIDAIGALGFLIAFFIALRNYDRTRDISSYWLVMSVALGLGFFWAGAISLEWFGYSPAFLDAIETSIAASAITAFAIAAILTSEGLVKAVG